jgi:hypothetical protein
MLLEPDKVMKRLASGGDLSEKVENAIASLPESDDRRQLFLRIKARITDSPK